VARNFLEDRWVINAPTKGPVLERGGKSRFTRLLSTRVDNDETDGPQQNSAGGDAHSPPLSSPAPST
jgi:hypothetical protein